MRQLAEVAAALKSEEEAVEDVIIDCSAHWEAWGLERAAIGQRLQVYIVYWSSYAAGNGCSHLRKGAIMR